MYFIYRVTIALWLTLILCKRGGRDPSKVYNTDRKEGCIMTIMDHISIIAFAVSLLGAGFAIGFIVGQIHEKSSHR
jgi:hypothetical protein